MHCTFCNKEIDEDSKFCEFCGYKQPDEYHLLTFSALIKKNERCISRVLSGIIPLMYMFPLSVLLSIFTQNKLFSLGIPLAIVFLWSVYLASKKADNQFEL